MLRDFVSNHHRFRTKLWVKLTGTVAFTRSVREGRDAEELVRNRDTFSHNPRDHGETAVRRRSWASSCRSIDQRDAPRRKVGEHKTRWGISKRPAVELEAVVGAVVELGEKLGVPMPTTRAVYACAKMLDEKRSAERAQRDAGVNLSARH